jgi:hypothetical protein
VSADGFDFLAAKHKPGFEFFQNIELGVSGFILSDNINSIRKKASI